MTKKAAELLDLSVSHVYVNIKKRVELKDLYIKREDNPREAFS